jgi:hypothetical protein
MAFCAFRHRDKSAGGVVPEGSEIAVHGVTPVIIEYVLKIFHGLNPEAAGSVRCRSGSLVA